MSQDQLKDLQEKVAQLMSAQNPGTGGAFAGWEKPQPSAFGVQGVAVPVSVQTSAGKVRVYFQLPAEVATSPDALIQAIENMISLGIPVDAWNGGQSRNNWSQGGNNNYSGGYRSSYRRRW